MGNEKNSKTNGLTAFILVSQLGFTIATPIVVGVLVGHWLDEKFGTNILFLLLLTLLGIATGIIGGYRQIEQATKTKRKS